jgi:23S rRNA pseudouridine1911/1915/1917 synthase
MNGFVKFAVLGETPDLLAVDKPPGLLIHPTKPGGPLTLWDGLREMLSFEMANGGQVSIINRLDRETSGVVLVGKCVAAARACVKAMKAGRIHKAYLAIVRGWPREAEFEVDAPILRLGAVGESRVWLKRAVHEAGARAVTRFRVERRLRRKRGGERVALVRASPLTGRTHQIRVHLSHVGHPVIGDKLYGESDEPYLRFIETGWTEELREVLWVPRHALHSAMIEVELDGRTHRWESPLAEDLAAFVEAECAPV